MGFTSCRGQPLYEAIELVSLRNNLPFGRGFDGLVGCTCLGMTNTGGHLPGQVQSPRATKIKPKPIASEVHYQFRKADLVAPQARR